MPRPLLTSTRRSVRARRWLPALWPLTVALAACGQPAAAPTPATCESAARAGATSLRILVGFHHPTVGDAPAVLAQLQAQAGACVRHVASISPTLHAYTIDTPADIGTVSARLLRWPAVKAVEADALVQRH